MHESGESTTTAQRVDKLLRSLIGVSDVRVVWGAHSPRSIHLLRSAGAQTHTLIRNAVSGLQAAFGLNVLPTQVRVHDDRALFDAVDAVADVLIPAEASPPQTAQPPAAAAVALPPAPPVVAPAPPAVPVPTTDQAPKVSNGRHSNGNGNGNGNGHANGNGHGGNGNGGGNGRAHAEAPRARRDARADRPIAPRPAPASGAVIAAAMESIRAARGQDEVTGLVLERIDLERRNGKLRCHTVIHLDGRTYSAIAEAPDGPTVEADLAARVALDALRAGGLTNALLDGVGFISIAGMGYCVASIRESGTTGPRAGAAPMVESMAGSATAAVLSALGTFTDARAQTRTRG